MLAEAPDAAVALSQALTEKREDAKGLLGRTVLEVIRLGGSNPTALWRRIVHPTSIVVAEIDVKLPANTMLWLDRRAANRDPDVFPYPDKFDVANIAALQQAERNSYALLVSRNRYEINSFSMVNAHQNPRKCPGRVFSIALQSLILEEMFGAYSVDIQGTDTRLAKHSAMPRPHAPGELVLTPKT